MFTMSRYDQWVTREPDYPEQWEMQYHCQVCGCWLKLKPETNTTIVEKLHCDGPDGDYINFAGWKYVPCETDCKGPYEYEEYKGVVSTYPCGYCGFVNEMNEY